MSQNMPYGGFKWCEENIDDALARLNSMCETDDVGRVYEVDVSYPPLLHDAHNDLPFLPHASVPQGSTVRKLMATLEKKSNYIVHYMNLKQAIENGLVVEKVVNNIRFNLIIANNRKITFHRYYFINNVPHS